MFYQNYFRCGAGTVMNWCLTEKGKPCLLRNCIINPLKICKDKAAFRFSGDKNRVKEAKKLFTV